jgi:hypothetical protein
VHLVNDKEKRVPFEQALANLLRRFLSDQDVQRALKDPT